MILASFDLNILDIIQNDCRLPAEKLAEQVGLSASAVQRRLKKLRDAKVITQEIAVIDAQYTAHTISFFAGLEIERDNYTALRQFKAWADDKKNIQQIYYVTGSVDLMVLVTAPSALEYDAFIEQLMAANPLIKRVTTNVILDAPKKSFYTPTKI